MIAAAVVAIAALVPRRPLAARVLVALVFFQVMLAAAFVVIVPVWLQAPRCRHRLDRALLAEEVPSAER